MVSSNPTLISRFRKNSNFLLKFISCLCATQVLPVNNDKANRPRNLSSELAFFDISRRKIFLQKMKKLTFIQQLLVWRAHLCVLWAILLKMNVIFSQPVSGNIFYEFLLLLISKVLSYFKIWTLQSSITFRNDANFVIT